MDREAIARIIYETDPDIEPSQFQGSTRRTFEDAASRGFPKVRSAQALAKQIAALASSTGVQAFYDAVREFGHEGQLIAVRIHHDGSGWDVYDPAGPNAPCVVDRSPNASPTGDAVEVVARAMREAVIRDDEGEFPRLFDLLGFSGENKAHTVVRGLARAAIAAMPPVLPEGWVALKSALLAVVEATRAYLPPDGIDAQECINRILAATDNPTITPIILEAENGCS